jgi:hypothetical protein
MQSTNSNCCPLFVLLAESPAENAIKTEIVHEGKTSAVPNNRNQLLIHSAIQYLEEI